MLKFAQLQVLLHETRLGDKMIDGEETTEHNASLMKKRQKFRTKDENSNTVESVGAGASGRGEISLDIGRGETLLLPARVTLVGGLKIPHFFSERAIHPYDQCQWEKRNVSIMDYAKGKPSFQREGVEVPAHWSDNSVRITSAKYLFGSEPGQDEYEDSLRHPFDRIANTYTVWGWKNGYFAGLEDARAYNWELKAMLVRQIWAPNSPVWFNIGHWEQWRWGRPDLRSNFSKKGNKAYKAFRNLGGLEIREIPNSLTHPQAAACFLTELEDSMESILGHGVTEGRIFSSGSGVGVNLSKLRSSHEPIAGRGRSSGPISFNKGWDRMAGAIKSGGRSRRAARMVILDSDHPDIFSFVGLKNSQEQIAKVILREHNGQVDLRALAEDKLKTGNDAEKLSAALLLSTPMVNLKKYDGGMDGEVYGETVSDQNANHSVSLRGDFWKSYWADGNYSTHWVTRPDKIHETFKARRLLEAMAESVYDNAEPGCHNNDYINLWSPVKSRGRIDTSNPCVTGDTLVAGEGLASIESLVGTAPKVINRGGGISTAKRVFSTGTKPVYQLRTKSGFGIKLTADHKVDTVNRGDVAACDLTKDDLAILRGAEFGNERIHPTIAYLAGLALGNGCVTHGNDQKAAEWTFGAHEKQEAERVAQLINAYKDENTTGDGRGDGEVLIVQTPTGYKVSTARPDLVRELERLCTLDLGEEKKRLTELCLRLDKASLSLLLRGYGDADGCAIKSGDKDQHMSLDSTSEGLLEQIQIILLSFGIKGKLCRYQRDDKTGKAFLPDGRGVVNSDDAVQMQSLRISQDGRVSYEKQIGFCNASKKCRLSSPDISADAYANDLSDEVESVEYIGELPVYDLTEPETSHFVANGIVVHNCSEYLHANNTSCNLSSFNAYRFLQDGTIDISALRAGARLAMIAADLNVEEGGFPIRDIAEGTYRYRTTGIGFGNIGGLLMSLGIPYDSDEGRWIAALMTSELTAACWSASSEMASELGTYEEWRETKRDLEEVLDLHKTCHDLLLTIPRISGGETAAEDVIAELIKDPQKRLPQAERLSGSDALRALVKSFRLSGKWDADRIKAAKHLVGSTLWDQVDSKAPMRNSFVSLYAPMGTISAPLGIYDEGTTSAEPDYTLVKYKTLSGGGSMTMFNTLALKGLKTMGYDEFKIREAALEVAGLSGLIFACGGDSRVVADHLATDTPKSERGPVRMTFENYPLPDGKNVQQAVQSLIDGDTRDFSHDILNGKGNVEGIPWMSDHHKEVFDCAATTGGGSRAIAPEGHIRMLGALTPFISGAVSKTVNLPHYSTKEDILRCFELSHQMGVKCIALYRADSKGVSVYAADSHESNRWKAESIWTQMKDSVSSEIATIRKEASKPKRRKMPGQRPGQIVKFEIGGTLDGFLIIGTYPDGRCGEVFGRLGRCGSFAHGMFESFCKAFSVMLQWGVPIDKAIDSFKNLAFDPAGFARVAEGAVDVEVKSCKSVVDLMMRILEWLFPAERNFRIRMDGYYDFIPTGGGETVEFLHDDEGDQREKTKGDMGAAEMCPECHSLAMIQDGRCKRCSNCGFSNGGCGG